MAEYIEREAMIDEIEGTTWYHISCQKNLVEGAACEADALYKATDIYNVIKSAPTADVQEIKHGKWKLCYEDWRRQIAGDECSACGFQHYGACISHYHYCPNCGAKMDGGDNNA